MKNILLIGLGRFGKHIALQLSKLGHEVMAVDSNEERVNEILPIVTNAQIGDSTNTEFLKSLGIGNFDVCIVTIGGNFQNSLETTSLLKELGAKLVVSRAERDVQAKFLLRNGADEVVYPEKQVANWAAIRYTADHIRDYIEVDETHAIFEVEVPEGWIGKTVGELDIRRKYSKLEGALSEVEATGYGIVMPGIDELELDEPEIIKQGGKYGVRLKASAPSIHLMRANIVTEVNPIVGSEKQSQELVEYLMNEFEEDPAKIWESNIFGKSLHELVNEGLHNKLYKMPADARIKLQETIERMINEGCGGLICFIL